MTLKRQYRGAGGQNIHNTESETHSAKTLLGWLDNGPKEGGAKMRRLGENSAQILIAEFEHLSASLHANEQSGEVRFNIFLLVVGAVTTFGTSSFGEHMLLNARGAPLGAACLVVVGVMGWFTLVRLVHRNLTTDDLKNRLSRVRVGFLLLEPELKDFLAFVNVPVVERELGMGDLLFPRRAGLVEVTCWINALVFGAAALLASTALSDWQILWVVSFALALLAFLCAQIAFVRRRYHRA